VKLFPGYFIYIKSTNTFFGHHCGMRITQRSYKVKVQHHPW